MDGSRYFFKRKSLSSLSYQKAPQERTGNEEQTVFLLDVDG
jgi:hypothetical protein